MREGKSIFGDGGRIATTRLRTGFAMTGFLQGVRCKSGGRVRAPRPTERFVGADDSVRPPPITQRLVGQGPCALPGAEKICRAVEEIGEALPVADEASRFRGSAPIGGHDSDRESVGTTVGNRRPLRKRCKRCGGQATTRVAPTVGIIWGHEDFFVFMQIYTGKTAWDLLYSSL